MAGVIIGITGGIATGKTAVSDELTRLGARVIDCDVIARFLGTYDPALLAEIRVAFGDSIFNAHGVLDRWALADIVFADEAKREQLEAILHPPVMAWVELNIIAARRANQTLVVVVPLLYEGGYAWLFDEVWVVTAELETQIERLGRRSGLERESALKMINAQLPTAEKELRADRILDNNKGLPELHQAVKKYWEETTGDHAF
jgi:dephospho-CoA kinase